MLYVASENIPAGHYVIQPDPRSDSVRGHDPLRANPMNAPRMNIAIGVARENLREGFRVVFRGDGFYEDDA